VPLVRSMSVYFYYREKMFARSCAAGRELRAGQVTFALVSVSAPLYDYCSFFMVSGLCPPQRERDASSPGVLRPNREVRRQSGAGVARFVPTF
jgi:hypothetical protein